MKLFTAVRAKLQTVNAIVEDNHPFSKIISSSHSEKHKLNSNNTNHTTLQLFNLEPCYNKFLIYYNLPLLSQNQNIGSFLQHLQQHKSTHQTIFSINTKTNEAHIYLPFESDILPQHIIINPTSLHLYLNTPLKSQYTTSSSSINPPLKLNIATHNVQGYNTQEKKLLWEDYCLTHNLHIVSLTETKISNEIKTKFWNTPYYSYFWSNSSESKEGTYIMISN